MKKASNIMYLVSMILGIILAAVLVFYGIALVVVGCIPAISEAIVQEVPEEYQALVVGAWMGGMISAGLVLLACGACAIVSAVLCHKGRTEGNRKIYILNIVFGALSGNEVAIAASILAIISDNKERNRKEIEVDAQVKDEAK